MHHRLIRPDDFPACIRLLPEPSRIGPGVRASLPSIWSGLYAAGQIQGGVIVEPQAGGQEEVVGFGLSVFLDEPFVTGYLSSPSPYLSSLVYESILSGNSPIPRRQDIAVMNASRNLNLVILHFGLAVASVSDERARRILTAGQIGFRLVHVGYRVKRVLQEAYGDEQLAFFKSGGFQMKSDYSTWYANRNGAAPSSTERPYLMGLYSSDPESQYPGSALSDLFQAGEPRFHFSPSEQQVLLRAVMDESDETIADTLRVTRDAVKKTWRRVYDRVAIVDPTLLEPPSGDDQTRGKEKRRSLIQYLRYHLEEIRPYARRRGKPDPVDSDPVKQA